MPDASLTLKVYDAETGRVDLVVTGISTNRLQTPQEVEKMVEELRYELQSNTMGKLTLDDLPSTTHQ